MNALRSGLVVSTLLALACGGSAPPPKVEEPVVATQPAKPARSGPSIEQELGSIDQRAVEKKFADLGGKFERCHDQGRGRVEYLAGDVKVFLRVGKDGHVRYAYFEESTLGDRETEKCLLDALRSADWPKPEGGEAEIRNGFGWPGGNERAPTSWGPEKVTMAIAEEKAVEKSLAKCKAGTTGDFRLTAYVEQGEPVHAEEAAVAPAPKHGAKKKDRKGSAATATEPEHGGTFKAIGITPPNKDGADKVDCIVDALRALPLPSPGSYAAKVTFSL